MGDPRNYVVNLMPLPLQREMGNGIALYLAYRAVEICEAGGYFEGRHALHDIVDHVIEFAGKPELTPLRDRLARPPVDTGGPLEARVLGNRKPFANRQQLRRLIDEMSGQGAPRPILAIAGASGSGKSYAAELIKHFCQSQEDALFCRIEITKDTVAGYGAGELAEELVSQMGGSPDPIPPRLTNAEAWYKTLAHWVMERANTPMQGVSARCWVVIDGCERADLRPDAAGFLARLQKAFTVGFSAKRHRLVYCGYPPALVSAVGSDAHRYTTEQMEHYHIEDVLRSVIEAQENFPDAEHDQLLAETLAFVLEGQVAPLECLREVGKRLDSVIEQAGL